MSAVTHRSKPCSSIWAAYTLTETFRNNTMNDATSCLCSLHLLQQCPNFTPVMSVCVSVCLSVCPCAYLRNHTANSTKVCARWLWPWLGQPVRALRCIIYFRFYGWRHVFTHWNPVCESIWRHKVPHVYSWAAIEHKNRNNCINHNQILLNDRPTDQHSARIHTLWFNAHGGKIWYVWLPCSAFNWIPKTEHVQLQFVLKESLIDL